MSSTFQQTQPATASSTRIFIRNVAQEDLWHQEPLFHQDTRTPSIFLEATPLAACWVASQGLG